jgi:hypothetical protein
MRVYLKHEQKGNISKNNFFWLDWASSFQLLQNGTQKLYVAPFLCPTALALLRSALLLVQ